MRQAVFLIFIFSVYILRAQVDITCPLFTPGTPYTYTYTQNFNSLSNSGTPGWTDNTTLSGWYLIKSPGGSIPSYSAGSGGSNTGAIYSYGSASSPERAFGSLASNGFTGSSGTAKNYIGLLFFNNTTASINITSISFTGEQWRVGDGTAETLISETKVSSSIPPLNSTGWSALGSLNFTTPIVTGSAGALDGNSAANRIALTVSTVITIPTNNYVMIRWGDLNDGAFADMGLAIDDLSIVFEGGTDCYTLPVTLTDFRAINKGTEILVAWTTETEINNDYFTLEKSADGQHFSEIEIINGSGISNRPVHYKATDENPLPAVNYYRLKQTDYAGIHTYSKVISADTDTQKKFVIYPDPAVNTIFLPQNTIKDYTVYSIHTINGNNIFSAPLSSREIDISSLPSGMYILKLSGELITQSGFFVKE